jgi:hypothetical protein
VGGRGQERLCAARVTVAGDDDAAHAARDLLRAAGVGVTDAPGPVGTVAVQAGDAWHVAARWSAGAVVVASLVGRPCRRCLAADVLALPDPRPADAAGGPAAGIAGALVATETLRALLGLATGGRVHALDLAGGTFAGRLLAAPGCAACGGAS